MKHAGWIDMPRVGVTYETIKHAAITLLSQGSAPSVQKVRDVLGTGSNTTIAAHLKTWREEYASQEIHHLPANMPKELISAIEILWQTAMDQASQQLASIKHDLNEQKETLRLDEVAMKKTEVELRTHFFEARETIENKNTQIQTLQTELAVMQEKSKHQVDEIQAVKFQYESQLRHAYDEKNVERVKNKNLHAEVTQLKQYIDEQNKKHQAMGNEERALQEESEKRWSKLIDQARTETIGQRKRFEMVVSKQNKQTEKLQTMLSELQHKQVTQQSMLNQKNERVSDQHNRIQEKYHKAMTTIAVLQERLNHSSNQSPKLKTKKSLKMVQKT